MDDQHIYHHHDNDGARVNVSVEKNTKGFNWTATVTGAKTVDEAMALLINAETQLAVKYSAPAVPAG